MLDTTQIASIGEEDFNKLFEDAGQVEDKKEVKPTKETKKEDKVEDKIEEEEQPQNQFDDVEGLLDDDAEEEEEKEEKKESGKESKKEKKEEPKEEEADTEVVNGVLKNTVDYLVEKGIWSDWDGRKEAEIDEKSYAEIAAQQDQHRVSQMFSELIDETGDYGKAIINFVKTGGDPDKIIDIFKAEKEIENFATDSEEDKKALISKYYKDVLNWNNTKISRHISTLIANEELEGEATDVKDLYSKHYEEELKKVNQEAQVQAQQAKVREESFKRTITGAISKTNLPERDKQNIEKSILQYRNKLPNGQAVSDFYVRFAEIQANPEEYIDLVRFAMDKEGYLKSIKTDINNKVVDKTFDFVKGNTALKTKKGTFEDVKRDSGKVAEFSFGLKKK